MANDDACMALAGVRYCLGRHTYMPDLCCGWLRKNWPSFAEGDRAQILREIKAHVADEERRGQGHEPGFAIDVETWRSFVAWEARVSAPIVLRDLSEEEKNARAQALAARHLRDRAPTPSRQESKGGERG